MTSRICCLTSLIVLGLAAPAAAAPTCSYDAGARVLRITVVGETVRVLPFLGGIVVQDGGGAVVGCSGGVSTVENTDEVEVFDAAPGGSEHLVLVTPTELVDSSGQDVLVDVDLGAFADDVTIVGSEDQDRIGIGTRGIDRRFPELVPAPDILLRSVENLIVEGRGGDDRVHADGSQTVTGGPAPHRVTLLGQAGDDLLLGGDAGDRLDGGSGADVARGGGGYDTIEAAGGGPGDDDLAETGPGGGQVSYAGAAAPVRVDLAVGDAQDTGAGGRDTCSPQSSWARRTPTHCAATLRATCSTGPAVTICWWAAPVPSSSSEGPGSTR